MSNKEKNNIPQFDDALPERLIGVSEEEAAQHVRVHHGAPQNTSPYIVRLSHEKGEPVGDALIVEDADIFPDEAPLVEYLEGRLHFAEDFSLSQIIEGRGINDGVTLISSNATYQEFDSAVPIAAPLAEPRDIFAELLAEEFEKEEVHMSTKSLDEALEAFAVQNDSTQEILVNKTGDLVNKAEDTVMLSEALQKENASQEKTQGAEVVRISQRPWKLHLKASLAFATLAAVILLPLQAPAVFATALKTKAQVEAQGSAGLSQFLRGTDALQAQDFSAASTLFGNASGAFASASASLNDIHGVVAAAVSLIPSTEKTATTADALLTIGEKISRASNLLARGMDEVAASQSLSITDRIAVMAAYIEETLPEMHEAVRAAKNVDSRVVPEDIKEKVIKMQALIPALAQSMEEVVTHAEALGTILGSQGTRTYMVVFQNNSELRPTGGFMGSFAEISFEHGAIADMRIPGGGTYDVQGQLKSFVSAPGPLQLINARWEFQDANWFPDFPTSARKMLWFYQKAGGPTVDGVLAINASVLEKVLTTLGPITLEDGKEFTAENVLFEVQKEAELTHENSEAPKMVIGKLTQEIFKKLESADAQTLASVTSNFVNALNEKEMQVYFSDNMLESTMEQLGWTGELRKTADDYLMVVHTNVGGGKTDTVMTRDVTVDTFISEDGIVENTVTLTQTHKGMVNALFSGINNVDYVRIYVPKGSEFITGTGFEIPPSELYKTAEYPLGIDEDLVLEMQDVHKDAITETDIWNEQGKTVFGNWMQTAPGETQTVTFTYRLPWRALRQEENGVSAWKIAKQVLGAKEALSYGLVVQKQSGVAQGVLVRVHPPEGFSQIWSSHVDHVREVIIDEQKNDIFTGWLFER